MINVAINGYGTIGKRVADAVAAQPDMKVIGGVEDKTQPRGIRRQIERLSLYIADIAKKAAFEKAGLPVAGAVEDMLKAADIVVDATPGGIGEKNKPVYERLGVKAIWQGGEDHDVAGFSFNSDCNYKEAIGKQFTRVVSCNTTGLCRIINAMDKAYGVEKVRAVMVRRGGDPADIKRGPIDAIVLNPVHIPSHHGPDVQSVLPNINIVTLAMIVPVTMMHMHVVQMDLKREATREKVLEIIEKHPRMGLVRKATGITSTAELKEYAMDLGRHRSDLWENGIFEESVSCLGNELYLFQAIHQEADVVVENIDCIRAMTGIEKDPAKSVAMTNKALNFIAIQ